jgi:hypothetical protein
LIISTLHIFCDDNIQINFQFTAILSITSENRQPLAIARAKCNSILHLFGEWLFDAAHIGSEMWLQSLKSEFYTFFFYVIFFIIIIFF